MASLGAPAEERFFRLPPEGKLCPDCGLSLVDLEALIHPCPENGHQPPVKSVLVRIPGREPVRVIVWQSLHEWLLRQDGAASYNTPREFKTYFARYHHCHKSHVPHEVEVWAGPFLSSEIPQLDKAIVEQESAKREVWLVYTRKAVWVGFKKRTPVAHG